MPFYYVNMQYCFRSMHMLHMYYGRIVTPQATFRPSLLSDPALRDKARSSSYGLTLAEAPRPPSPEIPPFRPEVAPV
jgi:hypothetical protein